MKIVQINGNDIGGGAEKICIDLHMYLNAHHCQSTVYVGSKKANIPGVIKLPALPSIWNFRKDVKSHRWNFQSRGKHFLNLLKTKILTEAGVESCYSPDSSSLFKDLINQTDIFHAHNLHGGVFDLSQLAFLSQQKPMLITLHDEWLLTGHCSCTLGCDRWLNGCGKCPHLDTYPAVKRDGTRAGWLNKKKIFEKSKIYVATPSQWLFDRVKRTMLKPYEMRLIRNGINSDVYYQGDQLQSRKETGLPQDAFILLYIANKGKKNPLRDYTTVEEAIKKSRLIGRNSPKILLIIGGAAEQTENFGEFSVVNIPYIQDAVKLAHYYRSADVVLYATKADNYPTIILEAMACGTTVVSTSVGGIPEQIQDQETGFCVPPLGSEPMARIVEKLYADRDLCKKIASQAASYAKMNFSVEKMARNYLSWYSEIIDNESGNNKK